MCCWLQMSLFSHVSIYKLTSPVIQLPFGKTSRWWASSSIYFTQLLRFSKPLGLLENMRDKWGRDAVFNYLQVSPPLTAKSLFLQLSFSLAFCQFSRLSNDLSDRSKPPGWDLGSVRKLGMPQWRLWHLHGNTQWIICPCIYWTDCLPVNRSEFLCFGLCFVRQFVCFAHDWSQVNFKNCFQVGNILGDKRSLMRHFCTMLLRDQ